MEDTTSPVESKKNPRSGKPPAFQFYPADWLSDVRVARMSLEQEGAYIRLLCFCWREGSLSSDLGELAQVLKVPEDYFRQKLWPALEPCFKTGDDGRLRQRRLDAERRKQRTFSRLQSQRRLTGIRNALQRTEQAVDRNATGIDSASASASARGGGVAGSEKEPTTTSTPPLPVATGKRARRSGPLPGEPEGFTRFYAAYPKKVDRGEALAEWVRLDPNPELESKILAGIDAWKTSQEWLDGKVLYPVRFLKRRRWESIPASPFKPLSKEEMEWKAEKERFLKGFR